MRISPEKSASVCVKYWEPSYRFGDKSGVDRRATSFSLVRRAVDYCESEPTSTDLPSYLATYTDIHERRAIRGPILDPLRLELRISSSHSHVPHDFCSCASELYSCLLEAASISERSLETFALVCLDAVTVFSRGHFPRSLVPRIRSKLLSCRINRKPGLWTPRLAFISDGRIVGVSNEGLPMVRI